MNELSEYLEKEKNKQNSKLTLGQSFGASGSRSENLNYNRNHEYLKISMITDQKDISNTPNTGH